MFRAWNWLCRSQKPGKSAQAEVKRRLSGLSGYIGRFAPSPTGALHAGSLVAALASWLDARAHGGRWLVRIEDVDTPRTVPGASAHIQRQLHDLGLIPDAPVLQQSAHSERYQQALDGLVDQGLAYPCHCSRKDIEAALQRQGRLRARHQAPVYPGTCRPSGMHIPIAIAPHACWRLRTDCYRVNPSTGLVERAGTAINSEAMQMIHWQDRLLGLQAQNVATEVGDFVLKRADACFTYQLAVVVDDAAQGITHVVRGCDLVDNTARQIVLQAMLGLPGVRYLHTPLVLGENGEKLSKQNGALAVDTSSPQAVQAALRQAARTLGLPELNQTDLPVDQALRCWTAFWHELRL
ncbi:MAG: tRNA glutamyl-Q(34) synthetase GluQRS [Rhodoferax sp.]|nr:tRNA glutamyl-Q(34) synthetase GluQRS [Rhodoferax sp.]